MSEKDMLDAFDGIPLVELTAPDGTVFRFRYGAMIPYAGEEYAVLIELEPDPNGEEQILVTRVEKAEPEHRSTRRRRRRRKAVADATAEPESE